MRTRILMILALAGLLGAAVAEEEPSAEVAELAARAEALPVWQHAELVSLLRKRFDERLLTPSRRVLADRPDLADGSKFGLNRILYRGRYEKETWARGGGAYFSFTTRTNDYDRGPDLELGGEGRLTSGFYGGCFGFVVELGAEHLSGVTEGSVPSWMLEDPADLQSRRGRAERDAYARKGGVYAVRSVREGEADTLAAFEILAMDDDGATFAWTILRHNAVWSRPR